MTSDGRWNYAWDAENRLLRVQSRSDTPQGSWRRVEWQYDALGRRIRQTTSNWLVQSNLWAVTEDVRMVSNPLLFGRHLLELNATNNVPVRTYVWGLDLSETMDGAGGVGGLLWMTLHTGSGPAAGTHFAAYDGNGNVVALSAASDGSETARYEYCPFGEPLRLTGPAATNNPFRFSTKRTEPAADLVLYEYRAYSPSTGRWLNRDPIEESGGRNLYGFVGNNPLTRFDALGLLWPGYPDWPQRPPPSKPPKYPKGFALCQRNIQKDGSCDCPAIFANAIGGEHAYLQYVDDEGNKWGYGFGQSGTAPEKHFDPNSCKPCKKTGGTLKHGSGSGKAGSGATGRRNQGLHQEPPSEQRLQGVGKEPLQLQGLGERSGCKLRLGLQLRTGAWVISRL